MVQTNAFSLFKSAARLCPERTALVNAVNGNHQTYKNIYSRSTSVANGLDEHGIGTGDRIFLCAYNTPEYVEILLAGLALGATVVPVNFRLAPRTIDYCLEDSDPECVFFDERLEKKIPDLGTRMAYRLETSGSSSAQTTTASNYENLIQENDGPSPILRETESPAVMFYTSGTSGKPKGVPQSHENLLYCSHSHISAFDLGHNDVTITSCPLSTAAGLNTLVFPLLDSGGRVVLTPKFDPATDDKLITRHNVTTLFAVPSVLDELIKQSELGHSKLQYVLGGGEPVPKNLKTKYANQGIPLHTIYGLTETTDGTHVEPLTEPPGENPTHIGKALPFVETKVVDDAGNRVQPGTPGELVMRGPLVTEQYWCRPDVTAEVWDGDWFHTGDIVIMHESGATRMLGRVDDMLIQDGENIYPAEVEDVFQRHPNVETAIVLEGPDHIDGLTAAVVSTDDSLTEADLTDFVSDKLASFKIPARIKFISSISYTAMGKTDRAALKRELFGEES